MYFSFLLINARSICNKLHTLKVFIAMYNPDILAVTESWGRPCLLDSLLMQEGYTLFRQDRAGRSGGGVFVLVKHTLFPTPYTSIMENSAYPFEDSVWCSIRVTPNKTALVGCLYRSPTSTKLNDDQLGPLFQHASCAPHDFCFLVGDFNCPNIDWSTLSSPPCSQFLLDCCLENYLSQVVDKPTRDNNILDLVFTNDRSSISSVDVCETFPGSDHRVVSCTLAFESSQPWNPVWNTSDNCRYDFAKADWALYQSLLSNAPWEDVLKTKDADEMWVKMKSIILNAADLSIPERKMKRSKLISGVPLIGDVRIAFRQRRNTFRSLRGSQSLLANSLRKDAEDRLQEAIRSSRLQHEKDITEMCHKNPKVFWSHVRKSLGCKPVVSSVRRENGQVTTSKEETADAMNNYFCSVFLRGEDSRLPSLASRTALHCDTVHITEEAVINALRCIRNHSSPGPDGIPNILLKKGGHGLVKGLIHLFRFLLENETLPSEWKTADVIPIFKKGSRLDCSNYRPVSLTCTACKVFERLIKDDMLSYLLENRLLHISQHGFLPRRSCLSAILSFMNDATAAIDDHEYVDAIYLDLSKAFDSISHKGLILKLQSLGFCGQLLNWIKCYLCERTQRVKISNSVSKKLALTSGVPQGSVLGPLLFVIFMDDIDFCIKDSKMVKFADDIKLYLNFPPSNPSRADLLQDDLGRVASWCSTWFLKINPEKSSCMHFGHLNPQKNYTICNDEIQSCNAVMDLGVLITDDLKPSAQCSRAIVKAQRMLSIIKLAFKHLDVKAMTILYKTFVLPILDYCCVAWCPFYIKDIDALEGVQRRYTRILEIHRHLPYEQRLDKYSLSSLYARRMHFDLVFMYKVIHGLVDIPRDSMFDLGCDPRTRGHRFKVNMSYSRLDIKKHFFTSRIVPIWNNLPDTCVEAETISCFKLRLHEHLLSLNIK